METADIDQAIFLLDMARMHNWDVYIRWDRGPEVDGPILVIRNGFVMGSELRQSFHVLGFTLWNMFRCRRGPEWHELTIAGLGGMLHVGEGEDGLGE